MENSFQNKISEYLEIEGRQLYWARQFSKADIFIRTIGYAIKTVFRIILFAAGLLGLLSILNHLWLVQQSGMSFFEVDAWQGKYLGYFWWSLIADMYLFWYTQWQTKKGFKPSSSAPRAVLSQCGTG